MGFVEIFFAFPGGGFGEERSGGTYDFRGTNCHRAFADVIRFATGRLTDRQGRKITDLAGKTKVLTKNVGVLGSSHGGNACGLVMLLHGSEFSDLAFYASMESPYGEGSVNVELGGREAGVNPAYNPKTGELDLSKLAWSPELVPGLRGRETPEAQRLRGSLFFDMNGDGKFSDKTDFPANGFVADLGQGARVWYSARLIREADRRAILGKQRPAHVPTLAEATEFWRQREVVGSLGDAVKHCPDVAVIVYAGERDHVQAAPDHPHIIMQMEGWRQAGARFVRLNADRAYVEKILTAGPRFQREASRKLADAEANIAIDRSNITRYLEPADLPINLYMQAAVCELADRVQAKNWSKNLDAVLFSDAPNEPLPGPAGGENMGPRPPLRPRVQTIRQ